MTIYIGREASKLWRRFCAETATEINLLAQNWKYILGGLILQYVHGVAARGVHYIHRPGPTLQDAGFFLLLELGPQRHYRLPGPNYHCREGSELATLPRPKHILEVFVIRFQGVVFGCGDLIFSSHMIFTLVFVITYHKYGMRRFIKQCAWFIALVQSLLIIASRKHYTVDVVVAWYTVNLVVFFIEKKLPELPDRTASQLPVSSKDRDGRHREETHKLLNGNSGDPADKRQRQQVNGKMPEDGNGSSAHDTSMNAS